MSRSSLLDRPSERYMPDAVPEGPDLAEILGATIALATEFDRGKREAIARALGRTGTTFGAAGNGDGAAHTHRVPASVSRSLLPSIERTGVGFVASGPGGYGDTLKVGMSDNVLDRARTSVGPLDFIQWWPVKEREYVMPVCHEASMAAGQKFGGFEAQFGLGETQLPAAVDGQVDQVVFSQNRLLIYTQISRDLWTDATKIQRWLSYTAKAAIRNALEQAIIQGVLYGPTSIINSPCTYEVPKGSTDPESISAANVDAQWAALSEGSSERAIWLANKNTINVLDELNASGQFPEALYFPAGSSPMGTPYGTIKGRPLIPNPFCAPVGNPGDLVVFDPSDFAVTYIEQGTESPLSFSIEIPDDSFHRGVRGLPWNAIEQRASSEAFFSTDLVAVVWRMRLDARFLWNSVSTNVNGDVIAPLCDHRPALIEGGLR